ncbi:membrane protein insertion efficiency factor YidD [Neisseria sp. 83E34]|uniref:membrane protein insertion efficiency factor YidD n=1 Tax=Neisseria sp. 83E34 TaxID=1692264 RepID=UPI0009EB6B07|nr:membrane protein insertion efficiency factor YidD [Neisseria sp. 83E34]
MRLSFTTRLALAVIKFYQHRFSPHKSYGCAYRCVYGGSGCSGVGYRLIRRYGWLKGWAVLQKRFSYCSYAAGQLQERKAHLHAEQGFCDMLDACDVDCADVKRCASGGQKYCGIVELLDCADCDWRSDEKKKKAKPKKRQRSKTAA